MTGNPFPVLTILSKLLRLVGWAVAACGLVYALAAGVIEPSLPNHVFASSDAIDLALGVGAALIGLGVVAYGELIGVAFAIEANTRRAVDLVEAQRASRT